MISPSVVISGDATRKIVTMTKDAARENLLVKLTNIALPGNPAAE